LILKSTKGYCNTFIREKQNITSSKNESIMDRSCLISAILFFVSNFLTLIYFKEQRDYRADGEVSFKSLQMLEPASILTVWEHRISNATLESWSHLLNAFAWFTLVIPVVQSAYVLSRGGKRNPAMHGYLALLVFIGSFTEFTSRLIVSGLEDSLRYVISTFNLNDWETAIDGEIDGMGWRVIEIIHWVTRGFVLWVDSFEWIVMFQILLIIYASVQNDNMKMQEGPPLFSSKWAFFGLFISFMCLFDFVTSVLRLESWRLWSLVSFVISIANRLIFMPIWLLLLGRQLPAACKSVGLKEEEDTQSTNEVAALAEPALSSVPESSSHSIS